MSIKQNEMPYMEGMKDEKEWTDVKKMGCKRTHGRKQVMELVAN